MNILLTVVQGSRSGEVFTIEPQQSKTFGRTEVADESFADDEHMSSLHFEVANLGSTAELRDKGSTNGTWLHREKITVAPLREGERFCAGKTVFTVEFVQPMPQGIAGNEGTFQVDAAPLRKKEQPSTQPISPPFVPGSADAPTTGEPRRPAMPVDSSRPATQSTPPDLPHVASDGSDPFANYQAGPVNRPNTGSPPISGPRPSSGSSPIEGSFTDDSAPVFQDARPPSQPGSEYGYAPSHRRTDNPLSDSSMSSVFPDLGRAQSAHPSAKPTRGFQAFRRMAAAGAAMSFLGVMDALAKAFFIELILHPIKIRVDHTLTVGRPLFASHPGSSNANLSPVQCNWSQLNQCPELLDLVPRLAAADACLAYLGKSQTAISLQIEQMLRTGVPGFSEPDGHLPCYWPSSLMAILDAQGIAVSERLFLPNLSGVVLCSPWNHTSMIAVADSELGDILVDHGFSTTDDVLS